MGFVLMSKSFEVLKSRQNSLVREIRSALQNGTLTEGGFLPIEGPTLLMEAFKSNLPIDAVLTEDPSNLDFPLLRGLEEQQSRVFQINKTMLGSMSKTETPAGVIALVRLPSWNLDRLLASSQGLFLVLVGLQDPGNLGTIIRCAEAFGVTAILMTKKTVSAFNAKSVRASAGSIFRVPLFQKLDEAGLFEKLEANDITTVATSLKARQPLDPTCLQLPLALFVGQEAKGLPDSTIASCQVQIRISTNESVQSLNVAIATGILLYEIHRHEKLN